MLLRELVFRSLIASPLAIMIAVGPDELESHFFPVAKTIGIRIYHRDNRTLCWIQDILKQRDLKYSFFSWRVREYGRSDVALVTPYDPILERTPLSSETTSKSRTPQELNQCFDLPAPMQGTQKVLIFEAKGFYETWHKIYEIPRRIGPVRVDGDKATLL